MNKFIVSLIISTPLCLSSASFAATNATLYHPQLRTNTYQIVPKVAGSNYAYWHHRHWHRGYHWDRGRHWGWRHHRYHHHRGWH